MCVINDKKVTHNELWVKKQKSQPTMDWLYIRHKKYSYKVL